MPFNKNKISVKVPKRSGFDKSHRNSGTLECGTITPLLCDEVIPNSRVSLKINLASQLPPLASDTYMNLALRTEAFFVPLRLLTAGFEDFFCDFPKTFRVNASNLQQIRYDDVRMAIPHFQFTNYPTVFGPGSLGDFLGIRLTDTAGTAPSKPITFSALPFIAYHLIWQEWYRNPRVQKPAFVRPIGGPTRGASRRISSDLPYYPFSFGYQDGDSATLADNIIPVDTDVTPGAAFVKELADGHNIFNLRQRNFGLDYFTGARVSPQQGAAVGISMPSNESTVTIAAIRAANSLQQFRERNNLPSPRLVDQVQARYGANLSDGVAQRPICIGSAVYNVSTRGIDQTAPSAPSTSGNNPFNSVGSQYGRAYASGSDFIIDDFTANEPGYIFVNITLTPDVTYSTGVLPMFRRYAVDGSITDMACSLLQNVGDQPIRQSELTGAVNFPWDDVFGYNDRYADFMFLPNVAHGRFRDGQDLDSFVLQRSFAGQPTMSSSFLEIPKNYLDQVFAVSAGVSGVACWYDSLLDYRVSMPLAEFSIPSLQDPAYEHGDTVVLRRNGQVF
nr:MAG: major capsid protein [Microviridae sp.]